MRSLYFLLFCLVAFSAGLYGQEVREELTPDDIIELAPTVINFSNGVKQPVQRIGNISVAELSTQTQQDHLVQK